MNKFSHSIEAAAQFTIDRINLSRPDYINSNNETESAKTELSDISTLGKLMLMSSTAVVGISAIGEITTESSLAETGLHIGIGVMITGAAISAIHR